MRPRNVIALFLLAAAIAATPAHADSRSDFYKVFNDYRADGQIDACKYTKDQLRNALKNIPPDVEQYAPGFEDAVRAALEQLARGECDKKKQIEQQLANPTGPAPPGPAAPPGATIIKPPPGPTRVPRPSLTGVASPSRVVSQSIRDLDAGAGAPAVVQVLGIAAVVLALIGLALAISRYFGWSGERWLGPLRTAAADAGARGNDFLADFRDWVRFGR